MKPITHHSPAIVSQQAVNRLPRWALWGLCMTYVLCGFIGREPWKSVDISAFGLMREIALNRSDWLWPKLFGQSPDLLGIIPYTLGAASIQIFGSWMPHDFAARIPFALLLSTAMAATWYGTYYLARLPAAQPVPFAFGGEAHPIDYGRSLADGALLALIAMLGLAQLGHETSATLAQLCFAALLFYAVAASCFHVYTPAIALLVATFGLALSGAPAFGLALCFAAALARVLQDDTAAKVWGFAILVTACLAATLAHSLGQWQAKLGILPSMERWLDLWRLWIWFTWPAWPLVFVALWRWRQHWRSMHIAWPALMLTVIAIATIARPGSDRTLLLATPALACLAALALPTLHRSISALIDWFTLLFFSAAVLCIWVIYMAMHTGFPAKPAANIKRLLPGFEPEFSWVTLLIAGLASLAWIAVIVWRTGRHRQALWKSLVLPASGMALCWLLLTTLWMPALNHARSYAPMMKRVAAVVGKPRCVHTLAMTQAQTSALSFYTHYELTTSYSLSTCPWLIADAQQAALKKNILSDQWQLVQSVRRRSNDSETLLIYKRSISQ